MKLPSVKDLSVGGKRVLLRTNYDVPPRLTDVRSGRVAQVADETRIEESLPTINYLVARKAKQIVIISHLGRPEGKIVPELSLKSVVRCLEELLKRKVVLVDRVDQVNQDNRVLMLENLRFWPDEEANDEVFAQNLASLGDFYINDAFACSHRNHASIVGVPKLFSPTRRGFGLDMVREIEILTKVRNQPSRPVVLILGGEKKDKIESAKKLISWADYLLIGGKLVESDGISEVMDHPKVIGSVLKNGQDITPETAQEFAAIIKKAKTVVWAGPMGNFYLEEYLEGTKKIAQAIVESGSFSVVGGGDTEVALTQLGLVDKINYISSGGGAMLQFLAEGTLPGIEAVING